ncbi:MAG: metal ABC transporter substrate-binding protein, partial [Chloroflexota bacterium]
MTGGRGWLALVLLLASAALAQTACTTTAKQASTPSKMAVVATFYPLQFLAQRIGGARADVSGLVPPGTEPHDYEPSPQDMVAI